MSNIRSRLKAAYERIEFEAVNTWNNSFSPYQRVNQELFVREKKVQDALNEELVRPRTVRDVIPNSKLAQYSNYEYNESRERSYASNDSSVYFYYPCIENRKSVKECWMLPEVEQLFIAFTYTPRSNILEMAEMEETNAIDDDGLDSDLSSFVLGSDIRKILPAFEETLERTPGKLRFKDCAPVEPSDILKFEPRQYKMESFEAMVVRTKIRSEKIKYLWSKDMKSKMDNCKIDTFNLMETPLQNIFLVKDDYLADIQKAEKLRDKSLIATDFKLRKYDCTQLELLTQSMQNLEDLLLTATKGITPSTSSEKGTKSNKKTKIVPKTIIGTSTPPRRLYSAVLQGLKKDLNNDVAADFVSPVVTTSSSSSLSTPSSTFDVLTPPYQSTPVLPKICSNGWSSPQVVTPSCSWETFNLKTEYKTQGNARRTKKVPVLPTQENIWSNNTSNVYAAPSNKNLGYKSNEATTSHGNCHSHGNGTNNVYFSNMYGSNTFFNNSYYNSQFSSNSFANSYQSNQPTNYGNLCYMVSPQVQVPVPNSAWCFKNTKPSTSYNVSHYPTQPYIFVSSQPRQMPHYTPPTQTCCMRTPMPVPLPSNNFLMHPYNTPPYQHYGYQDERTNSNHTMRSSSSTDCPENRRNFVIPTKSKDTNTSSDINFQLQNNQTGAWFHGKPGSSKFCSIDHLKHRYSAPILEYQSVKDSEKESASFIYKNSPPLSKSNSQESYKLSRRRTISEELEIHAVVQYQISGDDLEKQAEEQYFSENRMSPPCEFIFSGGILVMRVKHYLCCLHLKLFVNFKFIFV